MSQLLTAAGPLSALVALAAIALANVVIWFAGGKWTPQKRAYVGIGSVVVVLGIWFWASRETLPMTREGFVLLVVAAFVLVLAAAGAPVMKETFIRSKQEDPEIIEVSDGNGSIRTVAVVPVPDETSRKPYGVWSRP